MGACGRARARRRRGGGGHAQGLRHVPVGSISRSTIYGQAGCMGACSHISSQAAAQRRWGSDFRGAQACRATPGEAGGHRGRQWGHRNIRAQVP
eukprot:COSAG01_NODE_2609_length_7389_cov_19.579467_11_plen_94_part_00